MNLDAISFRNKLFLTLGLLLALAVAMSALALWGTDRSEFLLARSRLAHQVLDGHLRVAEGGQRLLRLVTIPAAPGSPGAAKTVAVRAAIDANLRRIRKLIAAEAALVGDTDDEGIELDRLAEIENRLADTLREHDGVRALIAAGRQGDAIARLARLNSGNAGAWRQLVAVAIDEETREVDVVDRTAARIAARVRLLLTIGAIAATVLAVGAVVILRRDIDMPLARLMAGTRALAAGDLSHRIGLAGGTELPRLARSFDRMAAEIEAQQAALSAARGGLEIEVGERTAELSAANARLAAHDATRRQLLADISHELRTPLTVVRGEAEVSLRGGIKPVAEYTTALERILEQARHMGRLVDDLLFCARQEAGEVRLQRRRIDLAELAQRACSDMDVLAHERGGSVACHLPGAGEGGGAAGGGGGGGGAATMVLGDADRLRQLLFILLDNALRYSDGAPVVTVALLPGPAGLVLTVADRGLGIPEADLPFVFERFQRGARAAQHDASGSGLGLFVARAIVAAHDGSIAIDSIEGQGTRVSVTLPAATPLRPAS